jgi:flagellin
VLSIAAGSSFGLASNSATVEGQIANQLAAQTTTTFAAGTEGGSGSNVVLNFTGADTTTAVTVTNTSLQRTANPTTLSGVTTQPANVGTASTGTLAITGAAGGDDYSGTIVLTQGGHTKTLTITSGVMGSASTLGTVQNQIATQLDGNADFAMTSAGTGANPTITFNGANNTTAVSIDTTGLTTTGNGALADTGTAGTNPTVGIYTSSVLSGPSDTFGIGSTITINGEAVTLDGKTGTLAAQAISNDSILSGESITAAFTNNRLVITGNPNGAALTVSGVGNLTDVSAAATAVTSATATAGKAAVAGTYVTSAMGTSSDTYGSNSILDINGTNVNISGDTGTTAASTIATAMQSAGITAAFASNELTITGKSDGTALTVTGVGTLTDVSSNASSPLNSGNFVAGQAVLGSSAITAASTVISLLHSSDTLSGTLNVAVAGGGTGSLTITSGESGLGLANQIAANQSYINAGITAQYSSLNNAVTITGPTGAANTITVTGTVTDSTVSTPGVGANFTSGTVSQLTAATASTVLTTVTAAVADVAYQRGTIGADVNELTSASNVASAESVNLTSAQDTIDATDYGQAASNLSKYQILSQTGISALAQANSVQQEVLKLLQ